MTVTRGFFVGLITLLALVSSAQATSKDNMELLGKHFQSLGSVRFQAFAPLGGPEIGVAETESKLIAARVADKGKVETLLSEPFSSVGSGEDFAFLNRGRHLLTYSAQEWTDTAGRTRTRGDIVVRDLTAEGGVKELFTFRDVVDLGFMIANPKFQDNLVWQPLPHFLNTGERLPVRSAYSRLLWDDIGGQYRLSQFLTPLPDADKDQAANYNNRAILLYRAGHLSAAARYFSQATQQAVSGQGIIAHNNELVSVEMEDLKRQGLKFPDQKFDEALAAYWCGEFKDALSALALRGDSVTEFDWALRGLALAQERRWAEVDKATDTLARASLSSTGRGRQFYADYLGEVIRIALLQGPNFREVAGRYLKALENVDRGHPAYVQGIANLLQRAGKTTDSQRVLQNYLNLAPADIDSAPLQLMLFEQKLRIGQPVETVIASAVRPPVSNLAGYVALADYYDLRAALGEIDYSSDTITINGQLDHFGLIPNAGDEGAAPLPDEPPLSEGGTVIKGTSK